jgi:hypothetical protein
LAARGFVLIGVVNRALDRWDERQARRLRGSLGPRGWLVSWHADAERGWRARLSGPGLVVTIERTAPTRRAAIARATRAMNRILEHHAQTLPPTPDGPAAPPRRGNRS